MADNHMHQRLDEHDVTRVLAEVVSLESRGLSFHVLNKLVADLYRRESQI